MKILILIVLLFSQFTHAEETEVLYVGRNSNLFPIFDSTSLLPSRTTHVIKQSTSIVFDDISNCSDGAGFDTVVRSQFFGALNKMSRNGTSVTYTDNLFSAHPNIDDLVNGQFPLVHASSSDRYECVPNTGMHAGIHFNGFKVSRVEAPRVQRPNTILCVQAGTHDGSSPKVYKRYVKGRNAKFERTHHRVSHGYLGSSGPVSCTTLPGLKGVPPSGFEVHAVIRSQVKPLENARKQELEKITLPTAVEASTTVNLQRFLFADEHNTNGRFECATPVPAGASQGRVWACTETEIYQLDP